MVMICFLLEFSIFFSFYNTKLTINFHTIVYRDTAATLRDTSQVYPNSVKAMDQMWNVLLIPIL